MAKQRKREVKLMSTVRNLEKAIEICNELTFNADGVNDLSKANAWGVLTLEKLGVIEVSENHQAIVRAQ